MHQLEVGTTLMQLHGFSSPQSQYQERAPRSAKEDVSQRWGISSPIFLTLFVHQHKFSGARSCYGCWIIVKYVCLYVYVCMHMWCTEVCLSHWIVTLHLPMCSKGEITSYSNAYFLLLPTWVLVSSMAMLTKCKKSKYKKKTSHAKDSTTEPSLQSAAGLCNHWIGNRTSDEKQSGTFLKNWSQ